jgi:DNA-binding NarL/FixJ family response regulator
LAATANPVRILIVDDDENYLAALRRIMHGHFEITTTRDPVQALKIVEHQGPFAVVISDYRMPLMNGIELFSKIAALNKHIHRILITGHADLQMAIDAVNHGKITAFLTKPTPAASIRSVVLEAINAYKEEMDQQDSHLRGGVPADNADNTATPRAFSSELYAPLTVKEKEVLLLLSKGFSNEEISQHLNISIGTVKSHINNLFGKMAVNSRSKVVAKAIELGIIKV